ncbi:acetyl-CoA carboxylase biotin carboxyl carrier protein [Bradyrhizobium sp. CCGUVB1N3]|uniref:acetyl-CoA carboxylase biotin carboxyl carrier protein n=1 Tax=Bradyrhizobium sp. CCGUVB1N3 TaxID=2949629 RepID=UPI0020B1AB37|nr:acetyl-CoA carboxylase biotin carboxyl carrier protein [Bradyrhizobium sp. CCGUVB1N3]MCP3468781.1 acetyl-CoA carboxylase biotin carboxyl carrier protein [Bradyrhizobium sp. CCGUVB1N3]
MDLAKIEQLVDLVSRSRIAELELTQDGTRIRILKGSAPREANPVSPRALHGSDVPKHEPVPSPAVPAVEESVVPAPMHGVFYRAAAPNEPPLVEIGSTIEAGQKICIIEAMKTFIDVTAETSGVVVAVLVEDGNEIEAGQALFRIRPAGPS